MSKGSFRPRRGKRATAISKGIILKSGEIFFEVPESGIGTAAGNIVMGDGTSAYADLPYYTESNTGSGTVTAVNHVTPDSSGNVQLNSVPYAENLLSSDNVESTDAYIFRTTAGETDIESGDADLDKIRGNCEVDSESGAITVATPSAFRAIEINQFDKTSMVLSGYTLTAAGTVAAQAGSYVCFAHAVGGLDDGYIAFDSNSSITRIGWVDSIPTSSTSGVTVTVDNVFVTAITNNNTHSIICNTQEGYVVVSCTNITKLCIHPRWSGGEADNEYDDYKESLITLPTKDADNNNLPLATYGFPSVGDVRDEMNLAQKTYTQRIGYYPYTASNLITVEAYGTPFIYDENSIFYVLKDVIVYTLPAETSSAYKCHDYGTEEFLDTTVPIYSTTIYGENLKDKLRRDVVTISKQTLSTHQRAQIRSNIDAAQNYLQFTEAEDAPNITLLNTIVSGNPMNTLFGASKRLLRRLDAQVSSKVAAVNNTLPDSSGNVTINRVPLADNLYSPDNNESYESYLYRTAGGTEDLSSGEAHLSFIRGMTKVHGKVEESTTATITSSHEPEPEEEYEAPSVIIDAAVWRTSPLGIASGTYNFIYNGTNWTYSSSIVDLSVYGLSTTGDLFDTDTITVAYIKAEIGTLVAIKPTAFVSIGLNQFNKSTMILSNYTINSSGAIVAQSGSYVAYCKAPYSDDEGYIAYDSNSTIARMGYISEVPAAGKTVNLSSQVLGSQISTTGVPETYKDYNVGYVAVACTNINGLCIHPRWSGEEDVEFADYTASTITLPTKDANNNNLPYISYGLPSVGAVADEINLDLKQYIQRVGHYVYSAANLATVQALGVDYEYDLSHIFYVLSNPITINLSTDVSATYIAHDYGTEHFEYTTGVGTLAEAAAENVLVWGDHLYGQNLRDKLRRDVLTISHQSLSTAEQTQVRSNIGAASQADLTQLNNDLAGISLKRVCILGVDTGGLGWYRIATVDAYAGAAESEINISSLFNYSACFEATIKLSVSHASTGKIFLDHLYYFNSMQSIGVRLVYRNINSRPTFYIDIKLNDSIYDTYYNQFRFRIINKSVLQTNYTFETTPEFYSRTDDLVTGDVLVDQIDLRATTPFDDAVWLQLPNNSATDSRKTNIHAIYSTGQNLYLYIPMDGNSIIIFYNVSYVALDSSQYNAESGLIGLLSDANTPTKVQFHSVNQIESFTVSKISSGGKLYMQLLFRSGYFGVVLMGSTSFTKFLSSTPLTPDS